MGPLTSMGPRPAGAGKCVAVPGQPAGGATCNAGPRLAGFPELGSHALDPSHAGTAGVLWAQSNKLHDTHLT